MEINNILGMSELQMIQKKTVYMWFLEKKNKWGAVISFVK